MDQATMDRIDAYIKKHRDSILNDLKSLVRIRSVSEKDADGYPFGKGCARVLEQAIALSIQHGFTAHNHDYWYGTARYRTARGKPVSRQIGIFSHLDVVEEGEGWMYSPFDPVEKEGFLIGRGAGDNKSAAVIGLYTLRAFQELGLPLHSELLLYFGCNEEKGMEDIVRFREEQPMPDCSMVPDLFFPVCHGEKGGLKLRLLAAQSFRQILGFEGGLVQNMVPDRAKATLAASEALLSELERVAPAHEAIEIQRSEGAVCILAKGRQALCSMPETGVNAIGVLAGFLASLESLDPEDRAQMREVAALASGYEGEALGIAGGDEISGDLTCVCVLAGTEAGRLSLQFAVRYPVTDSGERLEQVLRAATAAAWTVTACEDNGPLYLPAEHPYVKFLCEVYTEVTGRKKEPYVIGGGTYARKLKNAVGFGGGNGVRCPFLPEGHGGVHQPDEARSIEGILEAIKVYIVAILRLDRLSDSQWAELFG